MKPVAREDLCRVLMESSHDAILLLSPQGEIQNVNHAACTLLGIDSVKELGRSPVIFTNIFDLYTLGGVRIPAEKRPVSQALRSKRVIDFEGKGVRKDAGRTWYGIYSAVPVFDSENKNVCVIVTIKDVTVRVQALAECKRIAETYRRNQKSIKAFLEKVPLGIAVIGKGHWLKAANSVFRTLSKARSLEPGSHTIEELCPAIAAAGGFDDLERVFATGKSVRLHEFEVLEEGREPAFLNIEELPLGDEAGALDRILLIVTDASEAVRWRTMYEREREHCHPVNASISSDASSPVPIDVG